MKFPTSKMDKNGYTLLPKIIVYAVILQSKFFEKKWKSKIPRKCISIFLKNSRKES